MFLATTALSEFWDKDEEILFLGSWCLRHDRPNEWQRLKYVVMPSPWDDRERFYQAAGYLDEYGEQLLGYLAEYLNTVHGASYSTRYWRILVGPWLLNSLHVTYDRYVLLREAFSKYPDLKTIVLDPCSFRVPRDAAESIEFICSDAYNLQLFSQLLAGMGYAFPARELARGWPAREVEAERKRWKILLKRTAKQAFHRFGFLLQSVLVGGVRGALCDMGISRYRTWLLALRTGLRVIPGGQNSTPTPDPVFDEKRNGLSSLSSRSEFERLYTQFLPLNFPTLYLEGYQTARNEVRKKYRRIPPVVVSASGWNYNEPFKFLAAEAADSGSRLVAVQHGGGYGIFRFSAPELHETRLGDSYAIWGWANNKNPACQNLPSLKLSCLVRKRNDQSSFRTKAILFVATEHPRYLFRIHSMPVGSQLEDHFEWENRFLEAVPDSLRSCVLFRPGRYNYGHAVKQRISARFPDVRWDCKRSFYQSLKESRIVVIDHSATTFLEALVANIPTILFWDPHLWEVRDEAEPYFESLREVGILWNLPEQAAAKLAEIYESPLSWWDSPAVQQVRKNFVDRYALARKDWLDIWAEALEEELSLTQAKATCVG